jgi:hypothetical protein
MTLKTASRIETAIRIITTIICLPFFIVHGILVILAWPFDKILEYDVYFCDWIGLKLQQNCDEVKNGEIQNQYMIRNYTARFMYKTWQEFKNKENDGPEQQ